MFKELERAVAAIRAGAMVILVDDEDRENEGDLCMAASATTPAAINFMATHGRGLICLTLTEQRLAELQIPMMVNDNTSAFCTAFTVSIEARHGVSTGISAADRSATIHVAIDPSSCPQDLRRPGHIFPLRARPGGVLVRTGQTEGSVDLAQLAGAGPAGVICEIMSEDGTMARRPELERFASQHGLAIVSVADIVEYRLAHESLVRRLSSHPYRHPRLGAVTLHVYGTELDDRQHLAMVRGNPAQTDQVPLVRVHSEAPGSAALASLMGPERALQDGVLDQLAAAPCSVLVSLTGSVAAPPLAQRIAQLEGSSASSLVPGPAAPRSSEVLREFGIGAQILRDLGLRDLRLLSGQLRRLAGLEGFGLRVVETLPLASEVRLDS